MKSDFYRSNDISVDFSKCFSKITIIKKTLNSHVAFIGLLSLLKKEVVLYSHNTCCPNKKSVVGPDLRTPHNFKDWIWRAPYVLCSVYSFQAFHFSGLQQPPQGRHLCSGPDDAAGCWGSPSAPKWWWVAQPARGEAPHAATGSILSIQSPAAG